MIKGKEIYLKKYIKDDTIKTPLKVRMKIQYLIEIFGGYQCQQE